MQLAVAAWLCGCDVYDENRIAARDEWTEGADAASGDATTDLDPVVAPDANDAAPESPARCLPHPEPQATGCLEICPERCNALDDDCDGRIDETPAEASCTAPSARAVCADGQCAIAECLPGARDCDADPANGCEVQAGDIEHCGECGRRCLVQQGEPACVDDRCAIAACAPGFADCDGEPDACEAPTNTVLDCGGCGVECSGVPNAVPSCASGACGIGECEPGFEDCDGGAENGCETSLGTLTDCGSCGTACDKASCAGGVCTAVDCGLSPGRADCDGDQASCEVDLRADVENCGRCGYRCRFWSWIEPHGTLACTPRGCDVTCDPGFGDCDGDYRNGCEQSLASVAHCGACGRRCSIAAAAESCSQGSCRVAACAAGFADCDDDGTSCETPLDTPADCGGCGQSCELSQAVEACRGGACAIASCETDWSDCDGLAANGCEHDAREPSRGGLGPCLPDEGCSRVERGERVYYVCPTARVWTEARARCRAQQGGELVQLETAAERDFVRSQLQGPAWIALHDREREGLWVWARSDVPVWQGGADGTPIESRFAEWAPGEPNGSGDCAQLYTGGEIDDRDCDAPRPFVCEVSPDACPEDSDKHEPGQCGCDVPDTDRDGDGFATCADDCPDDPGKRAPGDCGCGVADADADGDGSADCIDGCDDDPAKREPGSCGCGMLETDGDGDGTPDCDDGCPDDASTVELCFPYDPANLDPTGLDVADAPDATLNCGTTTVDTTSTTPSLDNWCGAAPPVVVRSQPQGPDLVVFALRGLTIEAGSTLRLVGSRPVALVVLGDAAVSGTIDASASGSAPGAGGNWMCGDSAGADGSGSSGGGGGGGYGTVGGSGGDASGDMGGTAGQTRGGLPLVPLIGGCSGGRGGGCEVARAAGGGALQLSAAGALRVSGAIRANGATGTAGCGASGGGSGGGSGGAVLLEATSVDTTGAVLRANGGSGGPAAASGGSGSNSSSAPGEAGAGSVASGGGGGGGYGRVRVVVR